MLLWPGLALAERPEEPSGNLVRNGGFEMAGLEGAPEGWVMKSWRGDGLAAGRVDDRGRFDRRLLHLTSRDAMALYGCHTQPIEIAQYAGGQMLLSLHYRTGDTPYADAIIATYADDFTVRELDTPSLSQEEIPITPEKRWTALCRKVDVPFGARHAVLMLRVSGRGDCFIDGVALRALPAEVACDVVGAGLVAGTGTRVSIVNLRNTCAGRISGSLRMDVVEAERAARKAEQQFSLDAGEEREVRIEYPAPEDKPHRTRLIVIGSEEDEVYVYEDLPVPGLIDAKVTVPAFRSMLIDGIPTDYIQVEGRLHAVPELAGKLTVTARLAAAQDEPMQADAVEVDQTGRFSFRMRPGPLVSGIYNVHLSADVDRRPVVAEVPFAKATPGTEPVAYDETGGLWAGGIRRFPTGMAYVLYAEDLPAIAAAGLQFISVPSKMASTAFMDAAAANHLGVFISSASLESGFWENMADKHASRPEFWGWYVLENPELHVPPVAPEMLGEIYRELVALVQHRPVVCSMSTVDGMRRYSDASDIAIAWTEPRPPGDLLAVTALVSEAVGVVERSKPVWARIPICGAAHTRDRTLDPAGQGRPPTPDEYRAMVFLAIINGARGIVNYTYRIPSSTSRLEFDAARDAPAVWKRVGEVNRELAAIGLPMLEGTRQPHPNHSDDPAQYGVWEYGGRAIVILANRTGTRQVKPFVVDNLAENTLRCISGPEEIAGSGNGQFGKPLGPYEVSIYIGALR